MIIAVDPSGCHGPEDKRSDEIGIIVAGKDSHGNAYILEDASDRLAPGGKDGWGALVCRLYRKYQADFVVAEVNFGGAMVKAVIEASDGDVPFKEVHAARGKAVRADPVSALSDKGRVKLCGQFPELEQQLLQFSTKGFGGDRSPDRADAMVWAVWDLLIDKAPGQGMLDWYMQQASGDIVLDADAPPPPPAEPTLMHAPTHIVGTIHSRTGRCYQVVNGGAFVHVEDVEDMIRLGFTSEASPQIVERED